MTVHGGGTPTPPPPPQTVMRRKFWQNVVELVYCIGGIYACHLSHGFLQEKLVRTEYYATSGGGDGSYFTYTVFLVFVQTVAAALIAQLSAPLLSLFWRRPEGSERYSSVGIVFGSTADFSVDDIESNRRSAAKDDKPEAFSTPESESMAETPTDNDWSMRDSESNDRAADDPRPAPRIRNHISAMTATETPPVPKAAEPDRTRTGAEDKREWMLYAGAAAMHISAMLATNSALRYVAYPTQVLAKSAKPIPVMLMSVVFAGRSYPRSRYIAVGVVCAALALFMLNTTTNGSNRRSSQQSTSSLVSDAGLGFGTVLIVASLVFDGCTAAFQDKIILSPSAPTANQMMRRSNLWATLFLSILVVVSGELFPAVRFCYLRPAAVADLALLCIASSVAQIFIYRCVANFGPLMCSIVTTTRKFVSIIVSIVWFGHALSAVQWFAAVAVFAGLIFDIVASYRRTASTQSDRTTSHS